MDSTSKISVRISITYTNTQIQVFRGVLPENKVQNSVNNNCILLSGSRKMISPGPPSKILKIMENWSKYHYFRGNHGKKVIFSRNYVSQSFWKSQKLHSTSKIRVENFIFLISSVYLGPIGVEVIVSGDVQYEKTLKKGLHFIF